MRKMGFIGLDIAKDSFTAAFLILDTHTHQILTQHTDTFSYDRQGWQDFLHTWNCFSAHSWVIGLEASGPYSALIEDHLLDLKRSDFSLHRLSPAQVRDFAKSRSRRRTKTDRLDAHNLALFLLQQWTTHGLPAPLNPEISSSIARLARLYNHLTQELTRIQNQVRQILHYLFPELERRYARFPKALRTLLMAFPSAPAMAQASLQDLQKALSPAQARRLPLEDLHHLAQTSLGRHDPYRAQTLRFLLHLWNMLEEERGRVFRTLLKAVQERFPGAWQLLKAIPGIGDHLAALFLALVGDIQRFPSSKALVAFAGLDVTLYQSGKYAGRRRLSKRGSPLLRHILYLMAVTLKRYTRRFGKAYDYYRQQGRAKRETLIILARKILIMLYHLLLRQIPFQDLPPEAVSL